MITTIQDVFNWLGIDSRRVPYHLHLLNLRWSSDGVESDMRHYSELARTLRHKPEMIRILIRDSNWRSTLIGNTMTILLRASQFEDDLVWRLKNYTWVAPQVAVGIALVSGGSAVPELEMLFVNALKKLSQNDVPDFPDGTTSDFAALQALWNKGVFALLPSELHPKTILSAYCALKFLGHEQAERFEQTSLFDTLKSEDSDGCIAIAYHWNFWKNVKPISDQSP